MNSKTKSVSKKAIEEVQCLNRDSGMVTMLAVDDQNNVHQMIRRKKGSYGSVGEQTKLVLTLEVRLAERPTQFFGLESMAFKFPKTECDGELEFDEGLTIDAMATTKKKDGTIHIPSMYTSSNKVIRTLVGRDRIFYIVWKISGKKEQTVAVLPECNSFMVAWSPRVVIDAATARKFINTPVVIRPVQRDDLPDSTQELLGDLFVAGEQRWYHEQLISPVIMRDCSLSELRFHPNGYRSIVPGAQQRRKNRPNPANYPRTIPRQVHDTSSDQHSTHYESSFELCHSSVHTSDDEAEVEEEEEEEEMEDVTSQPKSHGPPVELVTKSRGNNRLFDDVDEETFDTIVLRSKSNLYGEE